MRNTTSKELVWVSWLTLCDVLLMSPGISTGGLWNDCSPEMICPLALIEDQAPGTNALQVFVFWAVLLETTCLRVCIYLIWLPVEIPAFARRDLNAWQVGIMREYRH